MATPTEVSEKLDIPPATLRRYVSLFGEHLSDEARRPRGRRFAEADVETLARIREMFASGRSSEEVLAALAGATAPPGSVQAAPRPAARSSPEVPPPAPQRPAPVDQENGSEDAAARALRRFQPREFPRAEPVRSSLEVQKLAGRPGGAAENLSQKVALNEDRLSRADERLSVLEYRLTRVEEWLRLPWYKRLFSRPPFHGL
ncbi:MAG: MerR family transcriptional regulator [Anaerolineae bacterium]|nr:MerR family transcriptional regulator [Anaerolineae bacterium]